MNKVSRFAANHPAVIGILLITLIFFGGYSASSLTSSLMPALTMPRIYIFAIYPGADAEDIESDVTKPIEDEMATLPSLKQIESSSGGSFSLVQLTFRDGVNAEDQLADVRYKLDRMRDDLPDDLSGDPWAIAPSASMVGCFSFSVSNADSERTYKYLKDEIIPQITQIPGVSSVTISPNADNNIKVILRLDDLAQKGISAIEVYQVLYASNKSLPLGESGYAGRGIALKYDGALKSIDDIKNLSVGVTDDNVVIKLSDVADVISEAEEDERNVIVNGSQAFVVDIFKQDSGDVMQICKKVKGILNNINQETGNALNIQILSDDSTNTWTTIKAVISSGVLGTIMAIISIWLCLADVAATIIISISIPLCMVFCLIALAISGKTINVMTLSGMVVALGMIVDASIVMLEQIYRYLGNDKYTVKQAIFRAAGEVAGSILGSVATTVVVFAPIILMKGLVGLILSDVALTIVYSMSASFIISIVVVPFLVSIFRKDGQKLKQHQLVNKAFYKSEKAYKRILKWTLDNRKYVLGISSGMLLLSLVYCIFLGITFLPSVDQSNFFVDITFPYTFTEDMTRDEVSRFEEYLRTYPELKNYHILVTKGMQIIDPGGRNIVSAHVNLVPKKDRKRNIHKIIPQVQSDLNALFPDADIVVKNGGFDNLLSYAAGGSGYGITLTGSNMQDLYTQALELENVLKTNPETMNTSLSSSYDARSVSFDMDIPSLSAVGATSYEMGMNSALLFHDTEVGRFTTANGSRYKISLMGDVKGKTIGKDVLDKIRIKSHTGEMIKYDAVGSFKEENSLTFINRKNRARTITVTANLISADLSGATWQMNKYLLEHPLREGITRSTGGMMSLFSDSIKPLINAVIIAVFLVYVVMVLQFERYKQPFIIMICIPYTFIGIVLGLFLFGTEVSIMAILAVVALSGTVVNNGIILVDYTNIERYRMRECHMRGIDPAILQDPDCDITGAEYKDKFAERDWEIEMLYDKIINCCASRIKPIFMTVVTTILGVVPMAFDNSEGAELYAPLGQAMFFGLFVSTAISLIVVPILYYNSERKLIIKKTKPVDHPTPYDPGPEVLTASEASIVASPTTSRGFGSLYARLANYFGKLADKKIPTPSAEELEKEKEKDQGSDQNPEQQGDSPAPNAPSASSESEAGTEAGSEAGAEKPKNEKSKNGADAGAKKK